MKERIQEAFGAVKADRSIKNSTSDAIERERARLESRTRGRRIASPVPAWVLSLVMFITAAGGYTVYATPVSYISLDTDSSVQLSINRFGRVLDVRDEDGEQITSKGRLRHMSYVEAIEELLSSDQAQEYIAKGEEVSVIVASERGEELRRDIQNCESCKSASFDTISVAEAMEAEEQGLSLSKYRVYTAITEAGGSLTPEECGEMSMRQLRDYLADLIGEEGGMPSGRSGGGGRGQGPDPSPDMKSTSEAGADFNTGGRGFGNGNGRGGN